MSLHDITPANGTSILGEAPQAAAIAHQINATEDLDLAAIVEPAAHTTPITLPEQPYYPPLSVADAKEKGPWQ